MEVTNLIDFCLQPFQIASVEPKILYRRVASSLVVTFNRSLDFSRSPYLCVLQKKYETPLKLVKTDDRVFSGFCEVQEDTLAIS